MGVMYLESDVSRRERPIQGEWEAKSFRLGRDEARCVMPLVAMEMTPGYARAVARRAESGGECPKAVPKTWLASGKVQIHVAVTRTSCGHVDRGLFCFKNEH